MRRSLVITAFLLTIVWIILTEELSVFNAVRGLVIGALVAFVMAKFLPALKMGNISMLHMITFPLFLVWQVYLAGFHVIKVILKGSIVGVITLDTKIDNEILRILLADSITLTPGSVLIDLNDNKLNLLWIRGKDELDNVETAEKNLKNRLERRLLRAQEKAQ